MKNFTFEITEKWTVSKSFKANTLQEARDMAQEFQDDYDILPDMETGIAFYDGSNITYKENLLGESK